MKMFQVFFLFFPLLAWAGSVPLPAIDITNSKFDKSLDIFIEAIENVGGIAFTGLGGEYSDALANLRRNAPSCTDDFHEMSLEDGSVRLTFGKDSTDAEKEFPNCVRRDVDVITNTFDSVDSLVTKLLTNALGKETLAVMNNTNKLYLEEFPFRSHLHVYKTGDSLPTSRHRPSYPFHTDNGLSPGNTCSHPTSGHDHKTGSSCLNWSSSF